MSNDNRSSRTKMKKTGVEVSIVLPACNEANIIENALNQTKDSLSSITSSFEIIIAEDGCTDKTDVISSELAGRYGYVKHLHSEKRLGRGRALKQAFSIARGEILVYIDVDLATEMGHLKELIEAIRGGYDFATGSRMLRQSDVKRPAKREIASTGFNFLVRIILRSKIRDHQCGFKSFKRDALFDMMGEVRDNHWFWDTETLVRAQRKGYRIKEFPVRWRHGTNTKVKPKDVFDMGFQIIRLWLDLKRDGKKHGKGHK